MKDKVYVKSMTNEDKFKTLLSRIHQNLLKDRGFKKDGQNFRQITQKDGLYCGYIINFQKSAYNDKTELKFTVNVGKIIDADKIDEKFKTYDCCPLNNGNGDRLAVIAPQYGFDKWWSVTSRAKMSKMEEELTDLIKSIAFPWLGVED